MSVKMRPYKASNYLETEDDIQGYLEAVLQDNGDDPSLIMKALANIAEARNMSQLARDAGMTRSGLYKALSEQGNPRIENVQKLARALGLELTLRVAR